MQILLDINKLDVEIRVELRKNKMFPLPDGTQILFSNSDTAFINIPNTIVLTSTSKIPILSRDKIERCIYRAIINQQIKKPILAGNYSSNLIEAYVLQAEIGDEIVITVSGPSYSSVAERFDEIIKQKIRPNSTF